MMSFLLPASDTITINKLLATSSTPVHEVLARSDLATFLRQYGDSSRTPQLVLNFIEKHLQDILLAAQQKNSADDEPGAAGTAADPAPVDAAGGGSGGGGSSIAGNGHSSDTHGAKAAAEEQQHGDVSLRSVNATELLFLYISSPDAALHAIEQIVPVSIAALAHLGALSPAVSLSVQRLLLAAFDNDFLKTTETIAASLTEEIVRGTVHNLSQSSVVAETLIALFGSALSASIMMAPSTQTRLFTSAWIDCRFVDYFSEQLPVVIVQRSHYNYFYFLRELLKRGFSHTAGPVVDVLLRDEFFATMLNTILSSCEVDATLLVPTVESSNSSLSPEGVAVVALIVSLLRKSLVLPETCDMYATTTDFIAPLRAVRRQQKRLVGLLQFENTSGAAIVAPATLGLTRLSVCELFTELVLHQLSSTDAIVVESGFLPVFLQLCETYARNNALARHLENIVVNVFSRRPMERETLADTLERDVLLRDVVAAERRFREQPGRESESEGGATSPTAAGALVSALVHFASCEAMRHTAVAAFSVHTLTALDGNPYFSTDTHGPLADLLAGYRDSTTIQVRVDAMEIEITGEKFALVGSAGTPAVRHRPVVNLVGDRYKQKLSLSISSDGGDGAGWGSPPRSETLLPTGSPAGSAGGSSGSDADSLDGSDDARSPNTPDVFAADDAAAEEQHARQAVTVDMDAIALEVDQLRAASSPQIQAYPNFRSMHLGFGGFGGDADATAPTGEG